MRKELQDALEYAERAVANGLPGCVNIDAYRVLAAEVRNLRTVCCYDCGGSFDQDECEYTGDSETSEWLCEDCGGDL